MCGKSKWAPNKWILVLKSLETTDIDDTVALFHSSLKVSSCAGTMKVNISSPATGCQRFIEVDDEHKPPQSSMRSIEVPSTRSVITKDSEDALGEKWKGYVVHISGYNDKQGFPVKQGVLTRSCVCLLLSKSHSCYHRRRTAEVWDCTVDANLSVLNLVIVKKGEKDPGPD